ncbi:chemotaxis protein CheB [Pelagicoccus albus]|uniref:histidine kinase n=1 Tax=Pelagicoccus albus TaxID=415222 RepID=A0A7X1E8T0_9BACT|nr:chemotaxis protein CheB [Pelagicoccus albus]MBC2606621.1 PAS domain-containing protein [Pelagicoccus albus]
MNKEPKPIEAEESTPTESNQPKYIVGIGASAGGLEALVQLFSATPANTGLAFVVVQHLSPDFKSVMDELLARHTDMPIHLVEDRVEIEANTVYLIPPKKEMVLLDNRLLLTDKDPTKSLSLPIDVFFRTLAQDKGEKAIAVVLSGTGSDGSRGIVDIHDEGGVVFCQTEESAKFNGMPRSAVETGLVDYVLSPKDIPQAILKYTGSPLVEHLDNQDQYPYLGNSTTDQYLAIFQRLKSVFKTDFSNYKPTTVNRRIERRMAHHKKEKLEEYIKVLDSDPEEAKQLYQDLLIGVTKFFRDPDAFNSLRNEVVEKLVQSRSSGDELRIWIPACATGEEAYSVAMTFWEAIEQSKKKIVLRIFGTDLHAESITFAAAGIYSQQSLEHVSKERINKFFKPVGEKYQINAELRKTIVFAEQNLLRDPPFTKIDLVTCRNMLIYLQPIAQKKVFTMFLFSLNVGGYLFLGPSESLGEMDSEFDIVDRQWNIFRERRDVRLPPIINLPQQLPPSQTYAVGRSRYGEMPYGYPRRSGLDVDISQAYDELLGTYMSPSLLVDSSFQLLHVFGNASAFIQPPKGRTTLEVLNLVNGNLRLALNTALQRATKDREPFTLSNIPIDLENEERKFIDLTVRPLRNQRFLLIQFEEHQVHSTIVSELAQDFDMDEETQGRILELEKELQFSRENLQATIEELETSNEEVQATNEELLASNEELQSTNEELQSVNEELFTVNTEYEKKNQELTQLNNDIDNLLQSTEIGTIFLDQDLKVRKFTPAIADAFNLLPMDIGRPFEHITFNIVGIKDIAAKIRSVIGTRTPIVEEVRNRDGKWQLMRILPYITTRNESTGAVLTLVDINMIKEAERELQVKANALSNAKEDLEEFAYTISHDIQEPLRSVSGYIDLLSKRFQNADSEVKEYLDFATGSSNRMKEMINGLLAYTRVETRAKPFVEVELSTLIEDAKKSLADKIEETNAEIRQEGCQLSVFCEKIQVTSLIANLIDNSLKFRSAQAPIIVVAAKTSEDRVLVSVRDNGTGVEPVNQSSVFDIFYRENGNSGPQGLGLGLALCKRIAIKHGGNITIDSNPGLGTTVEFCLPRNQQSVVDI